MLPTLSEHVVLRVSGVKHEARVEAIKVRDLVSVATSVSKQHLNKTAS